MSQLNGNYSNSTNVAVLGTVLVTQKGLAYINHLFRGKPSDGKIIKIV